MFSSIESTVGYARELEQGLRHSLRQNRGRTYTVSRGDRLVDVNVFAHDAISYLSWSRAPLTLRAWGFKEVANSLYSIVRSLPRLGSVSREALRRQVYECDRMAVSCDWGTQEFIDGHHERARRIKRRTDSSSSIFLSFCLNTLTQSQLSVSLEKGAGRTEALQHMLSHLSCFSYSYPVIDELKFAHDISARIDHLMFLSCRMKRFYACLGDIADIGLDEIARVIVKRLATLNQSQFNEGQAVLYLQLGYQTEWGDGHAIGVEVGRTPSKGSLYFKVENTGEGSRGYHHRTKAGKAYERLYTGCEIEDFGISFWSGLMSFELDVGSGPSQPEGFYAYLHRHLRNRALRFGRRYACQNQNDNCTTKAITVWLHGRMEECDYRLLRANMTEAQLGQVKERMTSESFASVLQDIRLSSRKAGRDLLFESPEEGLKGILREGEKVLERRRRKIF